MKKLHLHLLKIEAHLHKHFHMAAEHGSYILGVFIILHSHFAR